MIKLEYLGVGISDINIFIKAQLQPNHIATNFWMLFSVFSNNSIQYSLFKHFDQSSKSYCFYIFCVYLLTVLLIFHISHTIVLLFSIFHFPINFISVFEVVFLLGGNESLPSVKRLMFFMARLLTPPCLIVSSRRNVWLLAGMKSSWSLMVITIERLSTGWIYERYARKTQGVLWSVCWQRTSIYPLWFFWMRNHPKWSLC